MSALSRLLAKPKYKHRDQLFNSTVQHLDLINEVKLYTTTRLNVNKEQLVDQNRNFSMADVQSKHCRPLNETQTQ